MKPTILMMTSIALTMGLAAGSTFSADPAPAAQSDAIYGSQLMTAQERMEFRNKMRAAKTVEEREQIRLEHHKAMQERAHAQGKTLPDTPPAMGAGKGSGGGMGPGGGGMGPGGGRGR